VPSSKITPKIYLVHAGAVSVKPSQSSFKRLWPDARPTHLLDESLAPDLMALGGDSFLMANRFCALGGYCALAGAAAILFTCSAFGKAIHQVRQEQSIPVLGPYEALFEDMCDMGGRTALLTTFPASQPAMLEELRALAKKRKSNLDVEAHHVEGAVDALLAGDHEGHDRMVAECVASLSGRYRSIVLGQFSMSSALALAKEKTDAPVLTTPDSAVLRLRRILGL
jgi:Asp/Glu/hydantoin racemase